MGCPPSDAYFLTCLENGRVSVSAYSGVLAIISLTQYNLGKENLN